MMRYHPLRNNVTVGTIIEQELDGFKQPGSNLYGPLPGSCRVGLYRRDRLQVESFFLLPFPFPDSWLPLASTWRTACCLSLPAWALGRWGQVLA